MVKKHIFDAVYRSTSGQEDTRFFIATTYSRGINKANSWASTLNKINRLLKPSDVSFKLVSIKHAGAINV